MTSAKYLLKNFIYYFNYLVATLFFCVFSLSIYQSTSGTHKINEQFTSCVESYCTNANRCNLNKLTNIQRQINSKHSQYLVDLLYLANPIKDSENFDDLLEKAKNYSTNLNDFNSYSTCVNNLILYAALATGSEQMILDKNLNRIMNGVLEAIDISNNNTVNLTYLVKNLYRI